MAVVKLLKINGIYPQLVDETNDSIKVNSIELVGTTPLVISSNTLIQNLNAEYLNGKHVTEFLLTDGSTALSANLDAGLFNVKNLADPVDNRDAVNLRTLNDKLAKLNIKKPVDVATTANDGNIDLTSFSGQVDGVTVTDGMRVLIKNQSDGRQNGIYVYNASDQKFERATDFDNSVSGQVTGGCLIVITAGNENKYSLWTLPGTSVFIIGNDPLTFVKVSGDTKAEDIPILDNGNYFTSTNVEDAFQEVGQKLDQLQIGSDLIIIQKIAGEDLNKNDIVYMGTDGKVYKAKADDASTSIALGVVKADVTNGTQGDIQLYGRVDGFSFTSSDLGKRVFLSPTIAGQIQTYAPIGDGQYKCDLGIVISLTEIAFQRGSSIKITTN